MRIDRNDTPTTAYAKGIITPFLRISTHLGYCLRILETVETDDFEDAAHQSAVRDEILEAVSHSNELYSRRGFVTEPTVQLARECQTALTGLSDDIHNQSRDDAAHNITNLAHNMAQVVAAIERDLIGNDADPGIAL